MKAEQINLLSVEEEAALIIEMCGMPLIPRSELTRFICAALRRNIVKGQISMVDEARRMIDDVLTEGLRK